MTNRTELELIISEYLRQELLAKGHRWQSPVTTTNSNQLILDENSRRIVIDCLRVLSHQIRTTFKVQLNQMCSRLSSEIDDLAYLDYESFKCVANELFSDRAKWTHLICLLVFASELILSTIDDNPSRQSIDNVYLHLITYLNDDDKLLSWINDHDGWQGLIRYCNQHDLDDESLINKLLRKWFNNKIIKYGSISLLGVALVYCVLVIRNKLR